MVFHFERVLKKIIEECIFVPLNLLFEKKRQTVRKKNACTNVKQIYFFYFSFLVTKLGQGSVIKEIQYCSYFSSL